MLYPCGPEEADNASPVLHVASVALVDADNRVLLAKRPEGKAMAGLWEFPGGKLAAGEAPEAGLIRELKEELGIKTFRSCLAPFTFVSYPYPQFHLVMFLFLCRKWEGMPVGREGQELVWVLPKELRHYPMPSANSGLVAMLRDML